MQKQVYYKSDFSAILSFDGGWLTPFKLKFWTNSPSRSFIASFDGTTYTNCSVLEDGRLLIAFDSHNMGLGTLTLQPEFYLTAEEYADGVCNEVITPYAPTFTDDEGNDYTLALSLTGSSTLETVGTLPAYYKKGDKGDKGDAGDIDDEMSDTSTNAVQNKVIKAYVDDNTYTKTEVDEMLVDKVSNGENESSVNIISDYVGFHNKNGNGVDVSDDDDVQISGKDVYINGDNIKTLINKIDGKVDKVDGESLIDAKIAENFYFEESIDKYELDGTLFATEVEDQNGNKLSDKVDKEEGMSLVDANVANALSYTEDERVNVDAYMEVTCELNVWEKIIATDDIGSGGDIIANYASASPIKLTEVASEVTQISQDLNSLQEEVENLGGEQSEEMWEAYGEQPDYEALPLLCGQPPILFGAGTPQESIVPTNWKQFLDGGYNWNGLPSAIGQVYINTSASSNGRYTAYQKSDGTLAWLNF